MISVVLAVCLRLAPAPPATPLPQVSILATGGTIAGSGQGPTSVGYTSATVAVGDLIGGLPQLARIARVRGSQVMQRGSQDMGPADWLNLARRVQAEVARSDVDGVVITHGTDTLEESAYFLHLVVKTAKPVVLVGAMRPVTALSADGPFNLYEAVLVAAHAEAANKGVLVLMGDVVHSARDVTKANTSMTDAFRSPEVGGLGSVEGDVVSFYRAPTRRHTLASAFDIAKLQGLPPVEIAYGYAGASRAGIDAFVQAGARGMVFAGVGNGNFGADIGRALSAARAKGVVVVRSSRVGSGNVARNDEVHDDQEDFVVADNLNPQKARILLMLGLTQTHDSRRMQQMFVDY